MRILHVGGHGRKHSQDAFAESFERATFGIHQLGAWLVRSVSIPLAALYAVDLTRREATYLDPDHILSRFRYAPENCLTPSEAAAFSEWFIALFKETLCQPISTAELDYALASQWKPYWAGFGNDACEIVEIALPTPFDTRQLLQLWDACEEREAILRLASTLIFGIGAQKFMPSRLLTKRAQEQAVHWHHWFTLADHTEKLEKAFEREVDPKVQELLLAAM